MSTTYKIIRDGDEKEFEEESEFQDTVDLLEQNDVDFETEVEGGGEIPVADGDEEIQVHDTEPVEPDKNGDAPDTTSNPDNAMQAATNSLSDPLETLHDWMKTEVSYSDRGDSSITSNKRGCEVIANFLNLEPSFDDITPAEETDFAYAYYSCTVENPEGQTYTGYGAARADGSDQGENDGWKLDMMAQTRAYKRAVKFATGDGIQAFVEAKQ